MYFSFVTSELAAVRSLHLGGLPAQGEPLFGLPTLTQPLDAVSQGRSSAAQRHVSVSPSAAAAPSLAVFIFLLFVASPGSWPVFL